MTLFPETTPETPRPASPASAPAAPRLREANRTQVCLRPVDLESLLPEDHRARIVWADVEGLELPALEAKKKGTEPRPEPRLRTRRRAS